MPDDTKAPARPEYHTDDGTNRFRKGNKGGPGRQKGQRRLLDELWRALRDTPDPDVLDAAFEAAAIPQATRDKIAMADDALGALAEIMVAQAIMGTRRGDVIDRIEPAPRAVEMSGPKGGPIRTASTLLTAQTKPETAEEAYFILMHGGEVPDDEPNDADG